MDFKLIYYYKILKKKNNKIYKIFKMFNLISMFNNKIIINYKIINKKYL